MRGRSLRTKRLASRFVVFIAGAIGLLIAMSAFAWLVWLPRFRPTLGPGERAGIDVSSHQGRIDWPRVRRAGMSFAYIKATEGADFVDPAFHRNWVGAGSSGLDRGAYHFFTLCTPGADQAANFLRVVPDDPGMLPPAVDLELAGNCGARPPEESVRQELEAFVRAVEARTGERILLYIGSDFEARYPVGSWLGGPLWVRRLLRHPEGDWAVWQVGGFARVDGIDGRVDLDVMRGSERDGAR
jgi:lysozyme